MVNFGEVLAAANRCGSAKIGDKEYQCSVVDGMVKVHAFFAGAEEKEDFSLLFFEDWNGRVASPSPATYTMYDEYGATRVLQFCLDNLEGVV